MDSSQDLNDIDLTAPLTTDEALQLATSLHRAGHRQDAFEVYSRVLALVPDHPDALHYMGVLAHDQGHNEDALRLMGRSVELAPKHAHISHTPRIFFIAQ